MYSGIIAGVGGNVVETIAFVQEIVHIVPLINEGGGYFMPGGEELLEVALGIEYRRLWRIHHALSLRKGVDHLDVGLTVGCTGFAVGGANVALFGGRIVNHLTVGLMVIHGRFTVGRAALHKPGGWSSPRIIVTFFIIIIIIIIIGFPAVTTGAFGEVKIGGGFVVEGSGTALFGGRIVNHLTVGLVVVHGGFTVGRAALHKLGVWSSPRIVVTFIIIGFPAVTTGVFGKVKIFTVVPLVTFAIIPGSVFRKGERKKSGNLTTNYRG